MSISKINAGGTSHNLIGANVAYGTCATAAATAAKVVTVTSPGWELVVGSVIGVKFTYTNTASNPTLNVNSTGAKSIWYNTALITTGNLSYAGYASRVMYYMYDGAQYVFFGWSYDANTQTTTNSTNTSSKIFLIGATSQGSSKTTYSHDTAYVGTDGCLYSNSTKVSVEGHTHSEYAASSHNQSADTITAGTFPGRVNANATVAATLANLTLRNIYIRSNDMTAGTTSLATGAICLVYE